MFTILFIHGPLFSYSNVKFKEVAKIYRLLCIELDIVSIVDPMKYIAKVANKANLSEKIIRQAAKIM